MRILCLANISQIFPPDETYIEPIPYDEEALELEIDSIHDSKHGYSCYRDRYNLERLPPGYHLTEICIGYKPLYEDETKKIYVIEIYQTKRTLYSFKMLRSFATITFMDRSEGCFDLYLATSKSQRFYPSPFDPDFDLKIRAFCIKNPKQTENISFYEVNTPEEELAYNNYAKKINDFWKENPHITPENFRKEVLSKFGPLNLPNESTSKVLKQKLTDLETVINLLCDPTNGSYKNIAPNIFDPNTNKYKTCRVYQEAKCYLCIKELPCWKADGKLEVKKNFRDYTSLEWKNISLNDKIDFSAFYLPNLDKGIRMIKVNFGPSMKFWYKLAERINPNNLHSIELIDCGIERLEDELFGNVLPNIHYLSLAKNDITFISQKISNLINLSRLNLKGNKNLSDDGIPWSNLPANLTDLDLANANITKIPREIEKYTSLRNLKISSSKLNHICWEAFEPRPSGNEFYKLNFQGGGAQINDSVKLKNIKTEYLDILDMKFANLDCSDACFTSLHLCNNGLQNFNLEDINYDGLRILKISKNGLKAFSWKNIPKRIYELDFSYNQIKSISVPEYEEFDFGAFEYLSKISFEGNEISSLPNEFQYLPVLRNLNLSHNKFSYDKNHLTDELWNRLPKFFNALNISHNNICVIPCCISNISYLYAVETNLRHICPCIHTNALKREFDDNWYNHMAIDVRKNPNFKHSFIPNTIHRLPLATVRPMSNVDFKYFPTTTILADEETIRETSGAKYNSKAIYKFKTDGIENKYACECCAMCGKSTNGKVPPLFEQIMAMDSVLLIKKGKDIDDSKDIFSSYLSYVLYEPGKWKAKITTRLCVKCMEKLKAKIDEAFVEFSKKDADKNGVRKKMKKCDVECTEPSIQQPNFYNNAVPGPSSSSTSNLLPPIHSLFCDKQQEPQYQYFVPNQMHDHRDEPMDIDKNPNFDMENITQNSFPQNNMNPPIYNDPQAIILIDQEGNEVCSWNGVYPPLTTDVPMNSTFPGHCSVHESNHYPSTFPTNNAEFHQQECDETSTIDEVFEGLHFRNL